MQPSAPTVLIQDPSRRANYLIPGDRLAEHAATAATWTSMPRDTVTFVVPDEDSLIVDIPPYLREPGVDPAVLIQHPAADAAFFLTYEELRDFETDATAPDHDISFAMPVGMELIEELPAMMRGLLQSGESGPEPGGEDDGGDDGDERQEAVAGRDGTSL